MKYKPMMSQKEIEIRRAWQNAVYKPMDEIDDIKVTCFGRKFVVPKQVHPIAPIGLLQRSVLKEVRESDRVLDMGTGSGVNGVLAASKSSKVVAVDVNPFAVKAAKNNAMLNRVSKRMKVLESDLFEIVSGKFDLIIFDPPFRWFKPRDVRERGTADENFQTMTAFFKNAMKYLKKDGRILVSYGTTGDMKYFQLVVRKNNFKIKELNQRKLVRNGRKWMYFSYKLTPSTESIH